MSLAHPPPRPPSICYRPYCEPDLAQGAAAAARLFGFTSRVFAPAAAFLLFLRVAPPSLVAGGATTAALLLRSGIRSRSSLPARRAPPPRSVRRVPAQLRLRLEPRPVRRREDPAEARAAHRPAGARSKQRASDEGPPPPLTADPLHFATHARVIPPGAVHRAPTPRALRPSANAGAAAVRHAHGQRQAVRPPAEGLVIERLEQLGSHWGELLAAAPAVETTEEPLQQPTAESDSKKVASRERLR